MRFSTLTTYFFPHKIQCFLEHANACPEAGFIAHNLKHFDDGGPVDLRLQRIESLLFIDARQRLRKGKVDVVLPATSGLFFRRDVLQRILPMPEEIRITSDNYVKMAALATCPVLLIPDILAAQRLHTENAYTKRASTESGRIQQALMGARIAYHLRKNFPNCRYGRGKSTDVRFSGY